MKQEYLAYGFLVIWTVLFLMGNLPRTSAASPSAIFLEESELPNGGEEDAGLNGTENPRTVLRRDAETVVLLSCRCPAGNEEAGTSLLRELMALSGIADGAIDREERENGVRLSVSREQESGYTELSWYQLWEKENGQTVRTQYVVARVEQRRSFAEAVDCYNTLYAFAQRNQMTGLPTLTCTYSMGHFLSEREKQTQERLWLNALQAEMQTRIGGEGWSAMYAYTEQIEPWIWSGKTRTNLQMSFYEDEEKRETVLTTGIPIVSQDF